MDQFLICDEMIIPVKHLASIIKRKDGSYLVGRTNRKTGDLVTWDELSAEGFKQIKENLLLKKHETIKDLKKGNDELSNAHSVAHPQLDETIKKGYEETIKNLVKRIKDLELHISLISQGRLEDN